MSAALLLRLVLVSAGLALPLASMPARAQDSSPVVKPGDVIEFAADELTYSDSEDVVVASGNVRINRDRYRLTADRVRYDRRTGSVEATGNVVVIDPDDNRVLGDRIELSESLRDGAVDNILLILSDGGRLAARSGRRVNEVSTLDRAVYSPCSVVGADGCGREPVWAIRAVRVRHDPRRGRVFYRDARLDVFGVPLLYLPRLSHPDSAERNQAGLLTPDIRYNRSLGLSVSAPYYQPLGPTRDVTITPWFYTAENPALEVNFRQLLPGGALQVEGWGTFARLLDFRGNETDLVESGTRFRGYIAANGRIDHGNGWRSTLSVRATSDDTFLRRYEISFDDRLRSTYNLEHFGSEGYFTLQGWAFQGLSLTDRGGQTPVALPLVDFRWRPDLDLLGGRLAVEANTLTIWRSAGQDMTRLLGSVRWDGSTLTSFGARVTGTAMLRGDVYHTRDAQLEPEPLYAGVNGWRGRIIPVAAVAAELPLAGPLWGGTQVLTPRVQLVASSVTGNRSFPNEDSRAVDLEDSNLFDLNRFPGYDRWEDGARVTYGVQWSFNRSRLSVNGDFGQSFRLDDRRDIFPPGTGLDGKFSDYVGRLSARWGSFLELTQRVRIDKDSFKLRRNELDLTVGSRQTYATVGYVRLNRDIALEDLADTEELRVGARVAFLTHWSAFGSAIVDLTSRRDDPTSTGNGFQPIRHRVGVLYRDECFEFGVTWRRDYISDRDFRKGNTFQLVLALKNLG